jgi:hypothetical protein
MWSSFVKRTKGRKGQKMELNLGERGIECILINPKLTIVK